MTATRAAPDGRKACVFVTRRQTKPNEWEEGCGVTSWRGRETQSNAPGEEIAFAPSADASDPSPSPAARTVIQD